MDELKIVVNQELGVITTNFEEVKGKLLNQMEIYKQLEVTEENKTERKKDIATLRKIIKSINDKRIEVKKACLKPYETFETKATELVNIINEPINMLDNQVKEYEDKQRLQKIEDIKSIYQEIIGDLDDSLSIDMIYDSKWENVSASMKSIREEMAAKIDNIRQSISSLKMMVSDKTEEAINMYLADLDLPKAINFINRYEQQKREIQQRLEEQQRLEKEREIEAERERIRREEREAIAREERIKAEAEAKAKAELEAKEQAEREKLMAKESEGKTDIVTYKIIATQEEFEMVEMYMNSIGVEFIKGDF